MTHITFESPSIKSIGYSPKRNIMVVAFDTSVYVYHDVPWGVALNVLIDGPSIGKSVQSLIVGGKFYYEKIDAAHPLHPDYAPQAEVTA